MALKYFLISSVFIFTSVHLFSQDNEIEDDESCLPPDKKVMKVLKPTTDPKASDREKSLSYDEAIKMTPDNAYCRFIFAEYNYQRAQNMEKAYEEGRITFAQLKNVYMGAMNGYKKTIELCPDYHATPYYKIGYIYYMIGEKDKAVPYFQQFLAFNHEDPDKYPEEYTKWKTAVEDVLPSIEYTNTFYNNPVPFKPVIVNNISTEKDEFLPMISPDNELIFYTRRGDERNLGDMKSNVKEIFSVSERPDVFTDFNEGTPLEAPFNTTEFDNYGGVSLSLDNKEMFICACKQSQVYGQPYLNCDIYVTYFERSGDGGNDFTWTELKNLGPAVNTTDGWEAQPTLSADGNTLYFATYRNTSQKTDIYYTTRQSDGSWSTAQPVPGPINTAGHDKAPFLHQDSETMYFVSQTSDNRKGAGQNPNFDLYYTRKDSTGNWKEPINLGYPINTDNDEVGLIVSTDGKLAYFASNRQAGAKGFDLYYFELYEDARPKKVLFVKGEVKDDNGDPVKDAKVQISYKNSGETVEVNVNGDDGKFAAVVQVEENQDVMLTVKKPGNSFDTKLIKADEIAENKANETTFLDEFVEMEIGEIEVGKAFTIDNILFATDSYYLNEDSKFILDQFITFLKENPTVTVTIEGHTDDLGNDASNMILSENRAKASMEYLISKGINPDRLEAKGYGETKPKVPNNSDANRAINRRTDFVITGM